MVISFVSFLLSYIGLNLVAINTSLSFQYRVIIVIIANLSIAIDFYINHN